MFQKNFPKIVVGFHVSSFSNRFFSTIFIKFLSPFLIRSCCRLSICVLLLLDLSKSISSSSTKLVFLNYNWAATKLVVSSLNSKSSSSFSRNISLYSLYNINLSASVSSLIDYLLIPLTSKPFLTMTKCYLSSKDIF